MFKSNRLFINIGVLFMIFFLPWWMPLCIGLIMMWFTTYYELIVIGFLLDMLYGSAVVWQGYHFHPALFFTWLTFFVFVAFQIIKKKVRFQA